MTSFIQFLKALYPLSPQSIVAITDAVETIYLNKGETLFPRGKIVTKFCYVQSGSFVSYRQSEQKLQATRFWIENEIIFCAHSFITNQPFQERILALEDSILNCISYNKLQLIFKQNIYFYNHILKIMAVEQEHYMEWAFLICSTSYEVRYHYFLMHYNRLFNLISAEAIASSLNMSGSKLSRIRNRKS